MTFRIAVVQPISHRPPDDEKNVADALRALERAAGEGADFVCFPESYPGPWRMPAAYDPIPALADAAAKHGVHAVFGSIEPIDAKSATAYNLTVMAFPDGRAPARYRRSHPNGPWIYTGGKTWEFQYVAGDDYPVFDTVHGKVGLAMCSEVYMPEVTRALALRGAELIFMPAGIDKTAAVDDVADADLRPRHRESGDRGDDAEFVRSRRARPCHGGGAEDILFESSAAGISMVDVSLDRVRYLRGTRDELGSSQNCGAKQGVLGPQWQRPELYDTFHPRPLREAAE